MAEKSYNGRLIHKHDTEANWLLATNFIPKQAELIVYDPDELNKQTRLKIGDGVTNVNDLPFFTNGVYIGPNDPGVDSGVIWVDTSVDVARSVEGVEF